MKFITKNKNLKKEIDALFKIIEKNISLPILENFLFICSNKSLKIRATNLNLGAEIEIMGKVEKEGVLSVPAGLINNLVYLIEPEEEVVLEENKGVLEVKTNKHNSKIKTIPHDDFPTIPIVDGLSFNLSVEDYLSGLKTVLSSAATTDIRPEIAGVYMYSEGGNLFFVATDSFRLAEKKIKIKNKNQNEINGVIIPLKNILSISRILSVFSGDLNIIWNENQLSYNIGNLYLTTRIINGNYPNYRQIIPKEPETETIFLLKELEKGMRISNVFADKFNQITFEVNPKNKKAFLISKNQNTGEQKTEIEGVLKGDPISVAINYKYLSDALPSINSDSVEFLFKGSNKPIIVKGINDESFIYLIMPMVT